MLAQRVMTAIGLVAVLAVVLLLLPPMYAVVALAVMILAGAWEWAALTGLESTAARIAFTGACALVMGALWWFAANGLDRFESILIVTMLGWIPLFGWILLAPRHGHRGFAVIAGLWALAPTWLALARLYLQADHGRELVVFALVLAWAADIGAYFAGRYFGRLRLAPFVSPNKTWEGVLGGLFAGSLVALAGTAWFELPPLGFLSLCIAAVLVSVVGDLVESMFKRQRGMKDSGSILPGHGGVLDRIDSLTSSVPLLALGFCWLGLVT
jgi:phosphatidate cytidylyltransferase